MLNPIDSQDVEQAISYLVKSIEETGHNPKPVILHSIRTAMYLDRNGYSADLVVAALLHDLIEDSDATIEQIRQKFGDKVAALVDANSFDESIQDKTEQYKHLFDKSLKTGKEALIIKAADILDNSDYYHLAGSKELESHLIEKMSYFIELSKDILKDEIVWNELRIKHESLKKYADRN